MNRLTVLVVPLLLSVSCVMVEPAHDPVTESESVQLGKAEIVRAEVDMPAGEVEISGGATTLMDGTFTFTAPEFRPEVSYEETGFRGRLKVAASGMRRIMPHGNQEIRWKVKLNDETPVDLSLNLGAGEANLKLSGLSLRSVDVDLGAGEIDLDLRGDWSRDFEVNVRGGVGEVDVKVPQSIGVIAEAGGAIGEISVRGMRRRGDDWVNDSYGDSPVTIRLDIKGGIGEINIIAAD